MSLFQSLDFQSLHVDQIDIAICAVSTTNMSHQEIHAHWITASSNEGEYGDASARFPYWSFSKTVISVCALKLVEKRILDLDEPIGSDPFTLRHLLGHTSGLPDYGPLKAYHDAVARKDEPWSREKLFQATLKHGMLFAPGEGFSYSNIGYLRVRELIEDTSGKSLGDVISDLICKPLGLESIEFWETLDQSSTLYWDAAADYDPRWVYHGCLIGSASDASHLLHALFIGDLLKSETQREMLKRRSLGGAMPGRPWIKSGCALGLMSGELQGVGNAIGHSGAGPFCVNAVYHFPDRSDPITVACFSNGKDEAIPEYSAVEIAKTSDSL